MGKELAKIEIPLYIRTMVTSNSRNKKYYEEGKKELPKKYTYKNMLAEDYSWKKKGNSICLYNDKLQEFVIANPRSHGTPRVKTINGQSIYNGFISKWDRAKMMHFISDSFKKYIKGVKPITEYPIRIVIEIHDLIEDPLCKGQLWDLRNREFPYGKKFEDLIKGNIIKDDNILFYTSFMVKFIPIDTEERKLVFIIEKEDDERILKHKSYKNE